MNRRLPSSYLSFTACAITALTVLAGAPITLAQPLGNGNALDADLNRNNLGGRIPSNGRDVRALSRFNEAIITGNAPGGKSFRGGVGYGRGDDFRGSLGSNSLYQFNRDSAGADSFGRNIRSSQALNYQFSLGSSRSVSPNQFSDLLGSRAGSGSSGNSLSLSRSVSQFNYDQARRPSVLGAFADRDGRRRVITASTLRGLEPTLSLDDGKQDTLESLEKAADDRRNARTGSIDYLKPTRIDARLEPSTTSYNDVLTRFRDNGGLSPITNKPAEDPNAPRDERPEWMKRLDDLRDRMNPVSPYDVRYTRPAPSGVRSPTLNKLDKDGNEIKTPVVDPRSREAIMADQDVKATIDALKKSRTTKPVVDLAGQPPSDGKPTDKQTLYMMVLIEGQRQLEKAAYFDAEGVFTRLLALRPGDPMASAGRVHAQLGAGALSSAASNLRTLLAEHPEIIPIRYGGKAIFAEGRAEELAKSLMAETAKPESVLASDAGLLLGYLGFQYGQQAWLEEGVKVLRERSAGTPNEGLAEVVGEIWAGNMGPDNTLPKTEQPAPPAAEPSK